MIKSRSIRSQIKQLALDIPVDQTETFICPFCEKAYEEQGNPSEIWTPSRSFSISRTSTRLLFYCFRATCNERGFIPSVTFEQPVKKKEKLPKEYRYPLVPLEAKHYEYLWSRYSLSKEEIDCNGIQLNGERGSLAIPILDVRGFTVGYNDRDITGKRNPKAIAYWLNPDAPKIHFPSGWDSSDDRTIFVVEDQFSAIKVSKYKRAVALLGSNINDETIYWIRKVTDSINIMLDPDMAEKSIKIQKKYSMLFRNFSVTLLSNDPKDTPDAELQKVLSS